MLIDWQEYKLRECCKFNPASITSNWPHRSLRYIDISSVGVGIQTEPPKLFLRSEAPSRAQRLAPRVTASSLQSDPIDDQSFGLDLSLTMLWRPRDSQY